MNTLIYLKNLLHDRYVASITPTSRFGVERVLEKIDFSSNRVIVEYGPGAGVFTHTLLKNMTPDSRLIAIERNRNFCQILKGDFHDSRVKIFNDCASNVLDILKTSNEKQADYIISGIPFSFLSPEKKASILKTAYAALKTGGKFLAYQHFCQLPVHLRNHLAKVFHKFQTQYVMLAIPPLLIFEAVKDGEPLIALSHPPDSDNGNGGNNSGPAGHGKKIPS